MPAEQARMDSRENLETIVRQCQAGIPGAMERLVDMYSGRCYSYFYRLCSDPALSQDLLGELFLKLVQKIGSYRGGSFNRWLFTIASNVFADHLRARYRDRKMLDAKAREIELLPRPARENAAEVELVEKLEKTLARLDTETAELLMLRYYGELSFRELAEMRSEPIGTTLSKVHRGLKRLRELMGDPSETTR